MSSINQSIVTAFEELGMTPEQIAEEYNLEIESIKATLMQFSSVFRQNAKKDDQLNFTDQELIAANQTIAQIMQYSEDDNLRLRAARYLRDDKKGRLDAVKMAGLNINVLQFNVQLQKARKAIQESAARIIDLQPHEVQLLKKAESQPV
jgi:hypothetical protein